jgi:hypothetical protein
MEWKWAKANEKDLAKFVTEKSFDLLPKLPDVRFDLVHDPQGRRSLVEVIYKTLVALDIRYAYEKYHPEDETQLIRTPPEILLKPGEGTCLDLALLFCGICFGCDLLPLLVVIEGHALVAVSLKHKRDEWTDFARERSIFNTPELFKGEDKLAELRKFIESNAYIAVECTGFAHTQSFTGSEPEAIGRVDGILPFERAINAGIEQLNNPNRPFQFAIDIAAARYGWKMDSFEIPEPPTKSEWNVLIQGKLNIEKLEDVKATAAKVGILRSGKAEGILNAKEVKGSEIVGVQVEEAG